MGFGQGQWLLNLVLDLGLRLVELRFAICDLGIGVRTRTMVVELGSRFGFATG